MKLKILRITTVPISLHKLLQGQFNFMQQKGIDIILASADGKEIEQIEAETGLKLFRLPLTRTISPLTDIKALWQTYKLIKQQKPDIVHTHTPKAGLIGMLAAKFAGVPIRMHTVAGLPLMQASGRKRQILNFVERLTSWSATGVYPNSYALADFMMKEKLVSSKKVKVIANGSSNGIDTKYFDPNLFSDKHRETLKNKLNISKGETVFVFIGRLVGDKGINELVQSFVVLQNEYRKTKLLLVGNEEPDLDPLHPQTQRIIQENQGIITTGWVDDVRPYLAIGDIFVFPSYREGFPNVVLQAGAMGLPGIVTDINGSNEIIKDKQNGLIIPVKDKEALLNAMKKLLENKQLRLKLAGNARHNIENKFQQQLVWEAIYQEYKRLSGIS